MNNPSIKKNYVYNTFYQILNLIAPLITAPYVSRIFGADGVGDVSFTNSIVTYFTLFALLGTLTYGQQEIAQHRDNPKEVSTLFWEIKIISFLSSLVCIFVWLVFVALVKEYQTYYFILTLSIIAVALDISWFYGGYEQFKFIVIRNTVVKALGILCLFLFVKDKNDVGLYLFINGIISVLGNLSMWTYLKKFIVKVRIRDLKVMRHMKQLLIYFIPTIATSIYTILDKTMIGVITKDAFQNGYYEQTTKIVRICLTVLISLNTVMAARIAYLFANDKIDEVKARIDKSMNFTMLVAIPMTFGLCGIASNFVGWFFGKGYDEVIPLMYVYSLIIIPIGISNCLGVQLLTPSGQRARSNKGIIAGSIVNFCLNMVMIPLWGAKGAALASVIAELAIAVIFVHMSKEYISWKKIFAFLYKPLIAATLMLFVIMLIPRFVDGIVFTVVQVIAGVIIYVIALFILQDKFFVSNFNRLLKRNIEG